MLGLGTIGTNWITEQFIEAALETQAYQLVAVYSRRLENAQQLARKYASTAKSMTELDGFLANEAIDVVYIASPNSLHFEQAQAAIHAGKHVIVEKPAVSTVAEMELLLKLAEEKQVCFFEAARNIHEENFQRVTEVLPTIGAITGACFTYMKYSSRYDAVLAGKEPNIFSLNFSGGALMDLGVYLLYASVAWFGAPDKAFYTAQKIQTGVDGNGTIILQYPNFTVTLLTGKTNDSFMPSEIYGTHGTIQLDAVNSIGAVSIYQRENQENSVLPLNKKDNPMVEEATVFAAILNNQADPIMQKSYLDLLDTTKTVNRLLEELRRSADIQFPADCRNEKGNVKNDS